MDVRVEIDVHGQLEGIDRNVFETFPEAACMIVDQNVNGPLLFNNTVPRLPCVLNVGEVGLVKVNPLEAGDAGNGLYVLDELWRQVVPDIDHDDVDAAKLVAAHELLG